MNVPASLHRAGVYYLPATLVLAYRDELTQRSLLELARRGTTERDIHGGSEKNETDAHFAFRFLNSASRPQHLLLGDTFQELAAFVFSTLSSGHVSILDLACGTGAGTLAILSILAELRRANVIPSTPLNVDVVGADFSQPAREVFESLMGRVTTELARTGIDVALTTCHWDATISESTSSLCDQWLAADANEYLVVVNNISGHGMPIRDGLKVVWQHISDRLASRAGGNAASWLRIESDIRSAKEFLTTIREYFKKQLPRHFSINLQIDACEHERGT